MIFPKFIKPGDTIAVTALSRGMEEETERVRFMSAKAALEKRGYNVIFTDNVFTENDRFGRSSSATEKARQFNELVKNPEVTAIYSAGGGDFLAEILPYIDAESFAEHPKWIQGFSDNTSILYYLATRYDVATAYGANFGDFGMETWDKSVVNGFGVIDGSVRTQTSFDTFQDGFGRHETGLEGYREDGRVEWKNVCGEKAGRITMEGRLLGGCMDVIMNISGTPYDGTKEFIERYKDDGIIWYLESFSIQYEQLMEYFWKMKEMGWFRYTKGIIFGRPLFYNTEGFDGSPLPTYEEIIHERLDELNVPIIMDADIGHKGPQFVMINGAMAHIESEGGKGSCTYM